MKTRWLRSLGERTNFPLAAGLEVQTTDVERWSQVLNTETLAALQSHVTLQNASLPSDACGYDVFRGADIEQYVITLSYRGLREPKASGGQ